MTDFIQVITAIDSLERAETLASALVERHLAGCCQIVGPIKSIYRWQEKIETAQEWQVIIKSSRAQWPTLERTIQELHTYKTPEILMFEVSAGSKDYLDW